MNRRFLALLSLLLAPYIYAFSQSDYKAKCNDSSNHSLQHIQICKKLARQLKKPAYATKTAKSNKKPTVVSKKESQETPIAPKKTTQPAPIYTNRSSNYNTHNGNASLSGLTFKPYTPGAYQQTTTSELNDES